MTYYLTIVFALYFLMMIFLLIGWRKVTKTSTKTTAEFHFISIVIAARNEEKNIYSLLNSLLNLNYPKKSFEVIVVDDHSTDQTFAVVSKFFDAYQIENASLLTSDEHGKKGALHLGISKAKGEIIVTTDADCYVPPNWLQKINGLFSDKKTQLCVGAVMIEPQKFFSRLQSFEFASVVGTGAATIGLGFPTMCNGANLSFRKKPFEKVNGYEGNDRFVSGDDQFLMQKIARVFPGSVSFLNFSDAVLTTQPQKNLSEFVGQRIRWAGKWSALKLHAQLLSLFVLLFQISWMFALAWIMINPSWVMCTLIGIKVFLEFFFLMKIHKFLPLRFDLVSFFVLQFLYAPYVIWVAVLSRIKGFVWKEREHS